MMALVVYFIRHVQETPGLQVTQPLTWAKVPGLIVILSGGEENRLGKAFSAPQGAEATVGDQS